MSLSNQLSEARQSAAARLDGLVADAREDLAAGHPADAVLAALTVELLYRGYDQATLAVLTAGALIRLTTDPANTGGTR